MKYALAVFIVLFFSILASADCRCSTDLCKIKEIEAILKKKASPKAVPPKQLAPAILRASTKYRLDYKLLTAIILVESRGVSLAYNSKTKDHGLGQINETTARAMGVSRACLYNWECNLDAAARVLSGFKPHEYFRYNCGTGSLQNAKLLNVCLRYERLVAGMQ